MMPQDPLDQLPDPELIRDRLQQLFREVRLLRRVLPLAEEAARRRQETTRAPGPDVT
jgi:hypothetical protein